MKNSNNTIGNRKRVVPRTNTSRYLLYFAPGRKPFELKTLVIFMFVFLFVYRTKRSQSMNSTAEVLCHVISCYVMLCHVMSCYVMLCHVILCYVMLCHVMSCYIMLYHVMSCYAGLSEMFRGQTFSAAQT